MATDTVTLIFNLCKSELITLTLDSFQILSSRFWDITNGGQGLSVTLTYDLWPPKSNQFILECK